MHWRGPDSIKCDAPPLVSVFRSSIQSLHLDKNGRHAGAQVSITWQLRLTSRLCFSAYILVLLLGDKGELGGVLLVLSCARRMIAPGRRVWRKTRSQSSHWWHLRWSKQPQDMFPGHNSPQGLLLHTFTTLVRSHKRFSTEIIFYTKLESSEGLWLLLFERGIWVSTKYIDIWKIRSWYQKYATSPFSGTCFSLGEKYVNILHILITNFFNHITKY